MHNINIPSCWVDEMSQPVWNLFLHGGFQQIIFVFPISALVGIWLPSNHRKWHVTHIDWRVHVGYSKTWLCITHIANTRRIFDSIYIMTRMILQVKPQVLPVKMHTGTLAAFIYNSSPWWATCGQHVAKMGLMCPWGNICCQWHFDYLKRWVCYCYIFKNKKFYIWIVDLD